MDMKRPLPLIIALIAVGAVGLLIARCAPGDDRVLEPASTVAGTGSGSATSGDVPLRIARTPLPVAPFDSVRVELESSANAGDAEAAYRLGHVVARCMSYEPVSDNAFDDMIAKASVMFGRSLRIGGRAIDDQDLLDVFLYSKDELDRTCAGTGELRRSGRVGDAYSWIHRAAELGHTGAMAEYADHALTEFGSHADLLDHAAEVARRREIARKMLDQALRSGEPKALAAMAKAHGDAGLLRRDRIRALAYWNAYQETTEGLALPPGLQRMGDEHYRRALDATQQSRAERLSVEILAGQQAVGRGP